MEENQNLRLIDEKLKKYISKSIYRKQLVECDTLMSRQNLNLFYDQMQQHFYQQNVKKLKKQRRHSLENEKILCLADKKPLKMNVKPQFVRKNKQIKIQTTQEKTTKQKINFFISDNKKTNERSEKAQNLEEINYFVRKVKNPKVVRYISLKPSLEQIKKPTAIKLSIDLNVCKSNKNILKSNFMQRALLFDKFKKSIKQNNRSSCLAF